MSLTVTFCMTLDDGAEVEVEGEYTAGEEPRTSGPVELCHDGSAPEFSLTSVMADNPDTGPVDIAETLDQATIDTIMERGLEEGAEAAHEQAQADRDDYEYTRWQDRMDAADDNTYGGYGR